MIDIRLKVFRSVALNLSFTRASRELYISQPAISKHIQELEKEFRVRLFERMGNKISLTPAGGLLLDHCEKIIRDYQQLDFDMNALRKKFSGELRIGASTTIAQYVMPEILADFMKSYPQLSISMLSENSVEIEDELLKGKIDIGMVEGLARMPQIKYTPFMKDELVGIVRPGNPVAEKEELTLDELKAMPLVVRERESGTLGVIENALSKAGLSLSDMNIVIHFGTTEGIKQFVGKTDCMGIVSVRAVNREIMAGHFKVIELNGLNLNRQFVFAEKRGEEGGPQSLLKEFITKCYKS